MQHLVVVAHPAADSFTLALTHAYTAELEALGHCQQTRDLYRMGFDPVLTAAELAPVSAEHPAPAGVVQAQAEIRAADVLTVIYPIWWLSMPAMLKGYIDRVFARGFAYESHEGNVHGLLHGKQAVMITLSGSPLPLMVEKGDWSALQTLQDTHIFRASGFELLGHLHVGGIAPGLPPDMAAEHIERVRCCARRHFAAAPDKD